jgi:predicted RNA-binding Zn ribbon-like protein
MLQHLRWCLDGVVTYYTQMTVSSEQLPRDLQLVIDFVNTLDLEGETDEIGTPGALAEWLRSRELLDDATPAIRAPQRVQAIELREALRAAMLAHNGVHRELPATAELDRAARRGQLSVRFCLDGSIRLEPRAGGFAGALAQLLVPVARAAADGTWERLKACRADACQWAFYDHSRNHSGRWCDMAVCGNRTKVRAYRTKRAGP